MPLISAEDLYFSYDSGKHFVLKGLSFSVMEGEFVTVLGDNGSGKSTLLSLIDALSVPTGGKLSVYGLDTADRSSQRKIRRRIGLVFQDPDSSFVSEILEDDTSFSPSCYMNDASAIEELTSSALSELGLTEKRRNSVRTLSGGEKQRASVAGVRTMDPDLYLFDESLSFLDGRCRRALMKIMQGLREKGKTVIQVTHYSDDAVWGDRVIVMKDGRIVRDGTPAEVLYDTGSLEDAGIVPPLPVRLIGRLRDEGFRTEGSPLTEEEIAREVKRCMEGH